MLVTVSVSNLGLLWVGVEATTLATAPFISSRRVILIRSRSPRAIMLRSLQIIKEQTRGALAPLTVSATGH